MDQTRPRLAKSLQLLRPDDRKVQVKLVPDPRALIGRSSGPDLRGVTGLIDVPSACSRIEINNLVYGKRITSSIDILYPTVS